MLKVLCGIMIFMINVFSLFYNIQLYALPDYYAAETQTEMNTGAYKEYEEIDKRLNNTYQKILSKYKNERLFIDKLKKSQRAWIKFRDFHIEALYPVSKNSDGRLIYGSVYPMCVSQELSTLTLDRIKQLSDWLEGSDENICSGSIKSDNKDPNKKNN